MLLQLKVLGALESMVMRHIPRTEPEQLSFHLLIEVLFPPQEIVTSSCKNTEVGLHDVYSSEKNLWCSGRSLKMAHLASIKLTVTGG